VVAGCRFFQPVDALFDVDRDSMLSCEEELSKAVLRQHVAVICRHLVDLDRFFGVLCGSCVLFWMSLIG